MPVNKTAASAIKLYFKNDEHLQSLESDTFAFYSARADVLTVPTFSNMVKAWCEEAGGKENYGSHTLRKTWGYHQLRGNTKTKPHLVLPLLMVAYGHSNQQQTLDYLCIQSDEVNSIYDFEL